MRPHYRRDCPGTSLDSAGNRQADLSGQAEKIRDARIPYEVPSGAELPDRLDMVLRVVYLIYTEGYSASSGSTLTRSEVSDEAIRLGRLLLELLPEAEVMGLLALMLLNESRRRARSSEDGELILLPEQDRSLWNRELIAEGIALMYRAIESKRFGPYTLQAAIAAAHAEALDAASTDWARIVGLYEVLMRAGPSPVVELNRAVAIAMRDGPAEGLALIEAILNRRDLEDYHLAHSARADLCRRLGRTADARESYQRALQLVRQEPVKRFLERRLAEILRLDLTRFPLRITIWLWNRVVMHIRQTDLSTPLSAHSPIPPAAPSSPASPWAMRR